LKENRTVMLRAGKNDAMRTTGFSARAGLADSMANGAAATANMVPRISDLRMIEYSQMNNC
jgi:hypothetical protein